MNLDRRAILLLGVALAACSREQAKTEEAPPEAARAVTDPSVVISPLYERYMTPNAEFPAFEDQAPWSNSLRTLLLSMMARSQAINEPILDFDPLIGAQDYQISDLSVINEAVVEGSHAVVRATFDNATVRTIIIYDLIWEDDRWKVDNVRGESWNLRQIAAAPNADAIAQ